MIKKFKNTKKKTENFLKFFKIFHMALNRKDILMLLVSRTKDLSWNLTSIDEKSKLKDDR